MGTAASEQRSLANGSRRASQSLKWRHAVAEILGRRARETIGSRLLEQGLIAFGPDKPE
jgi:hypothetical protein